MSKIIIFYSKYLPEYSAKLKRNDGRKDRKELMNIEGRVE